MLDNKELINLSKHLEISFFDTKFGSSLSIEERKKKIDSSPWLWTFKRFKYFLSLTPQTVKPKNWGLNNEGIWKDLNSNDEFEKPFLKDLSEFKKEISRLNWLGANEISIFYDVIRMLIFYRLW